MISEFGDVVTSLAANPDATTISIEDPGEIPKHQPGPSRGSGREEDDELLGNDDSDKTEVQTCLCNCFFSFNFVCQVLETKSGLFLGGINR